MNFKQLEAFLYVAELNSFTRAAKKLYMSQPAVSFQIRSLEDEFKVTLFQRTEKRVVLTEAGRMLYPEVKKIVLHYYKILEELDHLKGLKTGRLNIGASTIPGEYILPLFIGSFRKAYPGIRVQLRVGGSAEVMDWVNNMEVALGVTGTVVESGQLECEPWICDELILIAPAHSSWLTKNELSIQELMEVPLIIREPGSGTRKTIEKRLAEVGISLADCKVVMELGSTRAVVTAVQANLGVSFVSRWAAKELLLLNNLKEVKVSKLNRQRQLYLVRNPQAVGGGFAAKAFSEHIKNPAVLQAHGFSL